MELDKAMASLDANKFNQISVGMNEHELTEFNQLRNKIIQAKQYSSKLFNKFKECLLELEFDKEQVTPSQAKVALSQVEKAESDIIKSSALMEESYDNIITFLY